MSQQLPYRSWSSRATGPVCTLLLVHPWIALAVYACAIIVYFLLAGLVELGIVVLTGWGFLAAFVIGVLLLARFILRLAAFPMSVTLVSKSMEKEVAFQRRMQLIKAASLVACQAKALLLAEREQGRFRRRQDALLDSLRVAFTQGSKNAELAWREAAEGSERGLAGPQRGAWTRDPRRDSSFDDSDASPGAGQGENEKAPQADAPPASNSLDRELGILGPFAPGPVRPTSEEALMQGKLPSPAAELEAWGLAKCLDLACTQIATARDTLASLRAEHALSQQGRRLLHALRVLRAAATAVRRLHHYSGVLTTSTSITMPPVEQEHLPLRTPEREGETIEEAPGALPSLQAARESGGASGAALVSSVPSCSSLSSPLPPRLLLRAFVSSVPRPDGSAGRERRQSGRGHGGTPPPQNSEQHQHQQQGQGQQQDEPAWMPAGLAPTDAGEYPEDEALVRAEVRALLGGSAREVLRRVRRAAMRVVAASQWLTWQPEGDGDWLEEDGKEGTGARADPSASGSGKAGGGAGCCRSCGRSCARRGAVGCVLGALPCLDFARCCRAAGCACCTRHNGEDTAARARGSTAWRTVPCAGECPSWWGVCCGGWPLCCGRALPDDYTVEPMAGTELVTYGALHDAHGKDHRAVPMAPCPSLSVPGPAPPMQAVRDMPSSAASSGSPGRSAENAAGAAAAVAPSGVQVRLSPS